MRSLWGVLLLIGGLFVARCAEPNLRFQVVDARSKAPLAGVEIYRHKISRSLLSKLSGQKMEALPLTGKSGIVQTSGVPDVHAIRFKLNGYFDACALMTPGKTMGIITLDIPKEGELTTGYSYICALDRLMIIQMFPKAASLSPPDSKTPVEGSLGGV